MNVKHVTRVGLALAMVLLSGCAAQHTVETRRLTYTAGQAPRPLVMTPAVSAGPLVEPVQVPVASVGKRWGTVYFDFDQYVVKPEFLPVISEVAGALKANPQARIQLEGHTDRHGSREYNVSLGHRRAEAVRRVMSLHGVPDSQMEAVSFGKEKPASTNSTPDGDALNRRTELQEVR